MDPYLIEAVASHEGAHRHQEGRRHVLRPGMGARCRTTCDVKIDCRVGDLALFVGLTYPTVDLLKIDVSDVDFSQASLEAVPVPSIPPQFASITAQDFVHAIAK